MRVRTVFGLFVTVYPETNTVLMCSYYSVNIDWTDDCTLLPIGQRVDAPPPEFPILTQAFFLGLYIVHEVAKSWR